ncbi:hypothetical protein [Galactobacter sp.]|uniref:hypothetical protein n=1 Tax=Galactobacter sp. TaxID=2676125 RepID=UPI0025B7AE29|nr:hypothetical protein [Galactobacter sp.]
MRLAGTETGYSRGVRTLLKVVLIFGYSVLVAAVLTVLVLWLVGVHIHSQIIIGAVAVVVIAGLALLIPAFVLRSMNRSRTNDAFDVILEPNGLTLRGVGPIPWTHFAPAQMKLVMSKHGGDGYKRRAVMPLTDAGLATVNGPLHPDLRDRLFYATGPAWNYLYRYIAVPGVQGMNRPGFD